MSANDPKRTVDYRTIPRLIEQVVNSHKPPMNAPYRLTEGLYLEESGQMLPWVQSLHQLSKRGGKPFPEKGKTVKLVWNLDSVLGGLRTSIEAMPGGRFFLNIESSEEFTSVKEEYESIVATLKEKLGEPTETGIHEDSYGKFPWTRWGWGNISVKVTIAERFVEYVVLSVTNDAFE